MLHNEAVRQDGERENIFITLEELYSRSQRMLAARRFTYEEVRKLSVSITSVRTLLAELAEIESSVSRRPQSAALIRDLKDRYWDLEGMVKEARNNMERGRRRQV